MKRVYAKGDFPKNVLISCDVRPVTLHDGRTVLLTGAEWYASATDDRRLECARAIAYDEERRPRQSDVGTTAEIIATTIARRIAEMDANKLRDAAIMERWGIKE